MAKTTAKVLAMAMWMACVVAAPVAAAAVDRPAILVRLYDYARMSPEALAEVQRRVSEVYARAGVGLEWRDGYAPIVQSDPRVRVDVLILNREMADNLDPNPTSFGRAGHGSKRAYVYYERVRTNVRAHGSTTVRGLALVMAHELGHALLPWHSHSRKGLMKASWDGALRRIPDFLPAQAETIRKMVSLHRETTASIDDGPSCDFADGLTVLTDPAAS